MGLFGSSFEEKVQAAAQEVRALGLGVADLVARVEGKVVTLQGTVASLEAKTRVMNEFNARVETENTLNQIQVLKPVGVSQPHPPAEAPGQPGPTVESDEQWHVVVRGDTLSAIAQHYYGKGSLYMKIFEANRDQLSNPDLIKVGQRLRIPR
jgi:nucleoid-associated protein YgaU